MLGLSGDGTEDLAVENVLPEVPARSWAAHGSGGGSPVETRLRSRDGRLHPVSVTVVAAPGSRESDLLLSVRPQQGAPVPRIFARTAGPVLSPGIAHDLRQPLTAIVNFAEAARKLVADGAGDDRALAYIEKAVLQARRASEMVGRIGDGRDAGPDPHDTNGMIAGLAAETLVLAAEGGAPLEFDLARGLPGIVGDGAGLRRILGDLLRAALDRPHPDLTGRPHVRIASRRCDDGRVEISITRSGPGCASLGPGPAGGPAISAPELHLRCETAADGGTCVTLTVPTGSPD
ncbi:histidine kinase dimerization/phospho-acceptor domain-containing protein [Wenxinia saemankumensis]|nr:histidine kinase dimerization/phospho-acceptor domain-containing protein [Wenxinia saemankumensis]